MKGNFLKHFAFIITVFLLLQEVQPLTLRNVHDLKQSQIEKEKEDAKTELLYGRSKRFVENEKGELEENNGAVSISEPHKRNKRWLNVVLIGTTLFTMSVSLSWDIYLHERGCCDIVKSCDYLDDFDRDYEELREVSKQIDNIYNNAVNQNQYAVDLNYLAQELWLRILYFDEFAAQYITALDTQALANWNNESTKIKQEAAALNETLENFQGITLRYEGVFQTWKSTLLRLTGFFVIGGLFAIKYLVTYFSRNYAASLAVGTTATAQAYQTAAKGYNTVKTAVTNSNLYKWFSARFTLSAKMKTYLINGGAILLTALGVALEAWNIAQSVKTCIKIEEQAKEAKDEVAAKLSTAYEVKDNATWLYDNATESYKYLQDQLRADSIIGFAEQIRDLAGNASTQTGELKDAQEDIQAYIDGIGDAGLDETAALTQRFIDGTRNITFKLSCLTKKLNSFNYATDECAIGSYNIQELFSKIQEQSVEDAKTCVDNGYIEYANFSAYVEGVMLEQGLQTDCILNNNDKKIAVCDKWYQNLVPDSAVAATLGLTDDQVAYFITTCPPGTVTGNSIVEGGICTERYAQKTEAETLAKYYKYNSTQVSKTFYACPPQDLTDAIIDVICVLKKDGKDVDYFIEQYPLYNATQINATYHGCVIEWSDVDEDQCCQFAAKGWTPDDPVFGFVYDSLVVTYGLNEVNKKIAECNAGTVTGKKDYPFHEVLSNAYKRGHLSRDQIRDILRRNEEKEVETLKKELREKLISELEDVV